MTGPLLYIITYRKQCLKVLQKITVLAACLITHLCKSMWRLFCQQHHRGLLKRFSYIYFGDSTLDRYLQYWRYHSPTLNKKYIYLYIFKACSRNCSTNPIKQFSYLHFGDNIRSLSSILEIPQSYTKQEICIYIYIYIFRACSRYCRTNPMPFPKIFAFLRYNVWQLHISHDLFTFAMRQGNAKHDKSVSL